MKFNYGNFAFEKRQESFYTKGSWRFLLYHNEKESAINANNQSTSLPSTSVTANSKFEVKFSADVAASTVNTGTVYLTQGGVKQLATVSFDAQKKVATLQSSTGILTPGKEYVLTVDGVKNDKDVAVTKSTTSFTVSSNPIITSAEFTHTSTGVTKLDGAVVDTAQEPITLTFNKNMDVNTLNSSNIKLYNVTEKEYVALTIGTTTATSVIVSPTANLVANNDYRLEVKSGVEDLAGNKLESTSYNFFFDIALPSVDNYSPSNNATSVYNKITASGGNDAFKFRAQFTAAVDASTVNGTTVKLTDKAAGTVVDATVTYEEGSRYVLVTPKADLKETTQYEVVIDGVKTDKGLKVTKVTPSFTTGDFTAPTVVSSTPANAAEGVKVDGTLTVGFSEKMKDTNLVFAPTGNVTLENVTDKTHVTYTNFVSSLSQDGKTLTIKPSTGNKLDPNKTYRLTVKKTATDVANNPLAEDYKVVFNTEAAAATKLESVQTGTNYAAGNTKVESGVTAVAAATNLFINFDKALKTNAGTYKVEELVKVEKLEANGTYKALTTKASGAASGDVLVTLDNSNKSIKVTAPSADNWIKDTTYRVTVPTTVKDVNGNDVQNVEFTFTVGTKPAVNTTLSSPANFATDVAVNTPYLAVVINDEESALQSATLNSDNVKVVKKADGEVAPYSIDTINYEKKTVDQTAAATAGSKTVTTSAASNLAVGDIITMVGTTGTYVVTNVLGTAVTVDKNIVASISTGKITVHQGVVYKLNTGAKLDSNTEYDVKVTGVKDAAGNTVNDQTFTFRSETVASKLEITETSIAKGATGVAVNAPITFTFNQPINASTLGSLVNNELALKGTTTPDDSNVVSLYDVTNSTAITGKYVLSSDRKTLTVISDGFLKADTQYKVEILNKVSSGTSSTQLHATDNYKLNFQTEQTASVKPAITSALYFDQDGSGTVNAGDKLFVNFNTITNKPNITSADNEFSLDLAGGTLGTSASGVWAADGKSVTITLGASPTLIPNATKIGIKANITSGTGVVADTITLVTITK